VDPKTGQIIQPKFSCEAWDEDLDLPVDSLKKGECLLVISESNFRRPKRLNPLYYRKVLTPRGVVGWVHLDNCVEMT